MSDEAAQSANPNDLDELQDVPGLQKEAEQESWESEKDQESRTKKLLGTASRLLPANSSRLVFGSKEIKKS